MMHFYIIFAFLETYSEAIVHAGSSVFKTLTVSSTFVDKTLLIKHIVESKQNILVTTPPKFGKSTNIDTIKTFLEIEVDVFGDTKTQVNITTTPVNDTENLLYFKNKLKISEYPDVMLHLGRTPVILVDFVRMPPSSGVRCLYDAVKMCKEVVHGSYKTHEYLLYSESLSLEDKLTVRTWCDEHSYKTKVDNLFLTHGLPTLARLLYKHHGRRVFVLVDNHDAVVTAASYDVDSDVTLQDIVSFVYTLIGDVVHCEVVHGAFVTGVSQFPSIFNVTNFQTYKFLENHDFSQFFSFTKQEVDRLIGESEYFFDEKEISLAHKNCNGYRSKRGVDLYNPYSVTMFLKLKRTGRFFTIDDYPSQLLKVLKEPAFKVLIKRILQDKVVRVRPCHFMSVDDVTVRDCFRKSNKQCEDLQFILYLLNWGLVTYTDSERHTSEEFDFITIPNDSVKEFLLELK